MALNNSNAAPRSISILGGIADQVRDQAAGKREERAPSQFWANIGITLVGAGEDGGDLFVTLPVGLPLDDMKPTQVRGSKPGWIQLAQAKNALLENLKGAAGQLEPGERVVIEGLTVELYRKGEPEQTGTADSNPLIAQMSEQLRKF